MCGGGVGEEAEETSHEIEMNPQRRAPFRLDGFTLYSSACRLDGIGKSIFNHERIAKIPHMKTESAKIPHFKTKVPKYHSFQFFNAKLPLVTN
jgi:hypothetical protein